MSNSYFSQYESPNIVIVPTMSCNPSPPKRRKVGNNMLVPIVDNVIEKQKLNLTRENKTCYESNTDKSVNQNASSSKNSPHETSWASNYLQSIGMDKNSSIWSRKIPRKSASQRCVISEETAKITTVEANPTTSSKARNEKHNQMNQPKKIVTISNTLKDDKMNHLLETKNRIIKKNNAKNGKQSKDELTKPVSAINSSNVKTNKSLNILTSKKKNILNDDRNKTKADNNKKKNTYEQPTHICTSGRHNLQTKSEKNIKITAQKEILQKKERIKFHSKHSTKYSSVKHELNNKVEKPKIKSVVRKQNDVQDNKRCTDKTRHSTTKSNSSKPTVSYYTSHYKEKYKNTNCSMGTVLCKKNLKEVLKMKYDTEIKTKSLCSKPKTSKIKPKEMLTKKESDFTKSPIKRKKPITKIKLIINIMCNKEPNSTLCNESSSKNSDNASRTYTVSNANKKSDNSSRTCTVSNADLDFLNDFNIDEIVESLNICEEKTSQCENSDPELNKYQSTGILSKPNVISNTQATYINNTDAIDLIKTLKGEEDDDLMKIEYAEEFLFSNDIVTERTQNSHALDNPTKIGVSTISKTDTAVLVKMKEENVEMLSEALDTDSTDVVHILDTCNINKEENLLEIQKTILKSEIDELNSNNIESPSEPFETLSTYNRKEKIEQNVSNSNIDSYKKIKLSEDITEDITKDISEDKYEFSSLNRNKFTHFGDSLGQLNADNFCYKDNIQKSQKVGYIAKEDKIIDKKISNCTDSSNILEIEKNNKDIVNSTNDMKQNENIPLVINHHKPDRFNNEYQNYSGTKEVTTSDNEKCIKVIKGSSQDNKNQKEPEVKTLNNTVKSNILGNKVEKDKLDSHKEELNFKDDFKENKQIYLSENETMETHRKDNEDNTHGNIKSRVDLKSVLKLEEHLFKCSGSKYSIVSIIHTGKFSKIFKCKHPNGKYYALKMPITKINYNFGKEKTQMLYSLINDIPTNNLFIVYLANAFNVAEKWYFLMEYYPKNLIQVLNDAEKPFSIDKIQDFTKQLVTAVMILKNKNMVHLDIKPKHILINSSNSILKLCGFDSLCYVDQMRILPNAGTVNYRAPEVILGYESGFEIDVWSTALVLYEMATNHKLFPGIYNNDILFKQICTLGCVPYDMLKKSRYGSVHFIGTTFMRKTGIKGQTIRHISKFGKNNRLSDGIHSAYFEYWSNQRSLSQQECDIEKLSIFVKLLEKMLRVHPGSRLPIEFVYTNPFISNAYSYQKW